MENYSQIATHCKQKKESFWATTIPSRILCEITYTAVRGQSQEQGAVQRILNRRRIDKLKEFVVKGGDFPGSIVLNWKSQVNSIDFNKNTSHIAFAVVEGSAQILDGQHRIAGLKAAIEEDEKWGNIEIPVSIYLDLKTDRCAEIFLAINTEQKVAPKSLIYDLYGITIDTIDRDAERARDIAEALNQNNESPYKNEIKFPGEPQRKGGLSLSTVASSIKPIVEEKGRLSQFDVSDLERQTIAITNFFTAIQKCYKNEWFETKNVFRYASGFSAACQFFDSYIISYCVDKNSFEIDTIHNAIKDLSNNLIYQSDVKNLGGKAAVITVFDRLKEIFNPIREIASLKF